MTPFAHPRTTVTPLQLPPIWLIALVLFTLAAVATWATGQESPTGRPAIEASPLVKKLATSQYPLKRTPTHFPVLHPCR